MKGTPSKAPALIEITSMQSPLLSVVAAHTLKPSPESLYRDDVADTGKDGRLIGISSARTSEDAGLEVVKTPS